MKWICKKCGSEDVEIKLWVNPNTKRTVKPLTDSIDNDEDTYCHVCTAGGFGIKKAKLDIDGEKALKVVLQNGEEMVFVTGFEFEMKQGFSDGTVKTQEDYDNAQWVRRIYTTADRPYIERMINGKNAQNGLLGLRNLKV